MIIGFTGTRNGMTDRQAASLQRWLKHYRPQEFHHGQCVGADEQAAHLAWFLADRPQVIAHPPNKANLRSSFTYNDVVLPEKRYLERDRDIAEVCDVLIACPDGPRREHSGTWYTIDYAHKLLRTIHVILP